MRVIFKKKREKFLMLFFLFYFPSSYNLKAPVKAEQICWILRGRGGNLIYIYVYVQKQPSILMIDNVLLLMSDPKKEAYITAALI